MLGTAGTIPLKLLGCEIASVGVECSFAFAHVASIIAQVLGMLQASPLNILCSFNSFVDKHLVSS